MHRIDTPTVQTDKFGAGKNGFTRGNPETGVPATALDDDYFDAVQEELAGIVEAAGIILDKSNRAQVLAAIKKLIGSETNTKYLKTDNNLIEIKNAGAVAVAAAIANLNLQTTVSRATGALQISNNLSEIATAGTAAIAATLANLGLSSVVNKVNGATGNVQTATANFATGWYKDAATGFMIQYGLGTSVSSSVETRGFNIAFPTAALAIIANVGTAANPGLTIYTATANNQGFYFKASATNVGFTWIAIGY